MSTIRTYPLQNSAILRLNADREAIDVAPEYQRRGDVWTKDKKRLLIDSILNDYDIPKLYFHALSALQRKKQNENFSYAIVDGRQRLETVWSFIDGAFSLADDFCYLADTSIQAGGLTYSELASKYPRLKILFDSYTLPIICIETEDIELIEDMFSRLNEAVPLNAAEKRSAIGGPMAQLIKDIATHPFFSEKVRFSDRRYQHREGAARLLFLEFSRREFGRIHDTKKPFLDEMVKSYKENRAKTNIGEIHAVVSGILDSLVSRFEDRDALLRSQGSIPVFYLVMQDALGQGKEAIFSRSAIRAFYEMVRENAETAQVDMSLANYELLTFDRMSVQGTNDAASIENRTAIMSKALNAIESGDALKDFPFLKFEKTTTKVVDDYDLPI